MKGYWEGGKRKFKWKYVAWLLPFIIMWGWFYFVRDVALHDVWWGFPYLITIISAGIASVWVCAYCLVNDK